MKIYIGLKRRLLSILVLALVATVAFAGVEESIQIDSLCLRFRFDTNKLDTTYLDNPAQLSHLYAILENPANIDSIVVIGYSSPDGNQRHNVELSRRRAETLKNVILNRASLHIGPDGEFWAFAGRIRTTSQGENWDGLYQIIYEQYHRADRDQVLKILKSDINPDTKKWRIQQLGHYGKGATYNYILKNYMRYLRLAQSVIIYRTAGAGLPSGPTAPQTAPQPVQQPGAQQPVQQEQTSSQVQFLDTLASQAAPEPQREQKSEPAQVQEQQTKVVAAVKTNLLYDAVTAVNFSVEVPLSDKWSLLYQQHCPWWNNRMFNRTFQLLSYGGELRRWFTPRHKAVRRNSRMGDRLTGHFLGVYGLGGVLDLQNLREFDYQAEFFSAGLSYGYAVPLGRRLNMEFTVSAGYARVPYHHYTPSLDWGTLYRDRSDEGIKHYFGPTKLEVSLVLPIYKNLSKSSSSLKSSNTSAYGK